MEKVFSFQSFIFIFMVVMTAFSIRPSIDRRIFSFHNSNSLKGLFALCIIIFHVSKENDILFNAYEYFSVTTVGAFFFLSAYGLMRRYMSDPDYEKVFIKKRFVSLVLPYLIMTLIYWIYHFLIGDVYTLGDILHGIFIAGPIVMYSWFIVSIIYHYVVFYILMKLSGRDHRRFVYFFFLLSLVSFLCLCMKTENRSLIDIMFGSGIIYAYQERYLLEKIRTCPNVILLFFLVFDLCLIILVPANEGIIGLIEKLFFMMTIICFLRNYTFQSGLISFMGKISLEIYMCQGLAKMMIRRFFGGPLFVQDFLIYILCFVISYLMNLFFTKMRYLLLDTK